MCSFVFTNKQNFDINEVNRYIKLRGPDYTNVKKVNKWTFIHNLLSITGKFTPQPFISDDIVLVYNGEIYNYKNFGDYESDGDCLIPLYKEYGEDFIKYLDGEFAIGLIDFKNGIILAATDTFATKPLWVNNKDGFSLSIYESPLKALGLTNNKKIEANRIEIYSIEDFSLLKSSCWHTFNLDQYIDSFERWNAAFSNSIEKRAKENIRENVFIGLSSGYDSGAICCELLKQNIKFKAYSVVGTHENKTVLNKRHELIRGSGSSAILTPYTHNSEYRTIAHDYILKHVEEFKYRTHSSSSDYNEFNLSIHDDNGANGLSHVANLAKNDGYKIYLSGHGADEIISDYGFSGKKIYAHSNFGGLFPKNLADIFPWASFYGSSQISYLMKEEAVAGAYGLEARYPFLDSFLVQEFLNLTTELKNKWYKSALHNYLTLNNFAFDVGNKIGF